MRCVITAQRCQRLSPTPRVSEFELTSTSWQTSFAVHHSPRDLLPYDRWDAVDACNVGEAQTQPRHLLEKDSECRTTTPRLVIASSLDAALQFKSLLLTTPWNKRDLCLSSWLPRFQVPWWYFNTLVPAVPSYSSHGGFALLFALLFLNLFFKSRLTDLHYPAVAAGFIHNNIDSLHGQTKVVFHGPSTHWWNAIVIDLQWVHCPIQGLSTNYLYKLRWKPRNISTPTPLKILLSSLSIALHMVQTRNRKRRNSSPSPSTTPAKKRKAPRKRYGPFGPYSEADRKLDGLTRKEATKLNDERISDAIRELAGKAQETRHKLQFNHKMTKPRLHVGRGINQ